MNLAILILALIALAILIVLGIAARKPNLFRIERQLVINAPADVIASHIVDFHKWQAWSPWETIDPSMRRTYGGPDAGPGAVYNWEGTGKAGSGRMEITAVAPDSVIVIKLDFFKPFPASNTAEFTFVTAGHGTTVVIWAMYGPAPFVSKVMGTVFNMDKLVGGDFAAGLQNLKTLCEHPAQAD